MPPSFVSCPADLPSPTSMHPDFWLTLNPSVHSHNNTTQTGLWHENMVGFTIPWTIWHQHREQSVVIVLCATPVVQVQPKPFGNPYVNQWVSYTCEPELRWSFFPSKGSSCRRYHGSRNLLFWRQLLVRLPACPPYRWWTCSRVGMNYSREGGDAEFMFERIHFSENTMNANQRLWSPNQSPPSHFCDSSSGPVYK